MGQFPGKHELSELSQSETSHLNNTITSKETAFVKREGKTSNSLYENNITLIPKSDKDSTKKINQKEKVQTNIPNEHRGKNP